MQKGYLEKIDLTRKKIFGLLLNKIIAAAAQMSKQDNN